MPEGYGHARISGYKPLDDIGMQILLYNATNIVHILVLFHSVNSV